MPRLYSPPEAAQLIGIAEPTLRAWAHQHSALLSDYARKKRRQYTARDVAVLRAIKDITDSGIGHADVAERIKLVDLPDEEDAAQEAPGTLPGAAPAANTMQLVAVQLSATQADQAQRLTQQDVELAELAEMMAGLRERVARLEAQVEALQRSGHDHPGIVPTRRP